MNYFLIYIIVNTYLGDKVITILLNSETIMCLFCQTATFFDIGDDIQ